LATLWLIEEGILAPDASIRDFDFADPNSILLL